ncbi:hypothetical protein ABW19_dt0204458 [Dactylella cylindrospora]|nr:hypothetical protein ABW19_dt0204458 [Dactylella cylindrospora]
MSPYTLPLTPIRAGETTFVSSMDGMTPTIAPGHTDLLELTVPRSAKPSTYTGFLQTPISGKTCYELFLTEDNEMTPLKMFISDEIRTEVPITREKYKKQETYRKPGSSFGVFRDPVEATQVKPVQRPLVKVTSKGKRAVLAPIDVWQDDPTDPPVTPGRGCAGKPRRLPLREMSRLEVSDRDRSVLQGRFRAVGAQYGSSPLDQENIMNYSYDTPEPVHSESELDERLLLAMTNTMNQLAVTSPRYQDPLEQTQPANFPVAESEVFSPVVSDPDLAAAGPFAELIYGVSRRNEVTVKESDISPVSASPVSSTYSTPSRRSSRAPRAPRGLQRLGGRHFFNTVRRNTNTKKTTKRDSRVVTLRSRNTTDTKIPGPSFGQIQPAKQVQPTQQVQLAPTNPVKPIITAEKRNAVLQILACNILPYVPLPPGRPYPAYQLPTTWIGHHITWDEFLHIFEDFEQNCYESPYWSYEQAGHLRRLQKYWLEKDGNGEHIRKWTHFNLPNWNGVLEEDTWDRLKEEDEEMVM